MRIIKTTNAVVEMGTNEKKLGSMNVAKTILITIDKKINKRFQFSGLHTSNRTKRPLVAKRMVAVVESSFNSKQNIAEHIWSAIIIDTLHRPPGRAFFKTFTINLPFTIEVVGSMVKKNEGMPIVKVLISVH